MQLHTLTYMSTATHSPTPKELDHLVARAKARNEIEGVTGALIYSEGGFIQCIEGDNDALSRIYEFIKADRLHHSILELIREPIEAREFAEWSMTLRSTNPSLNAYPSSDRLHQMLMMVPGAASPARHLLAAFWNGGLGTRHKGNETGLLQTP